MNAELLKTRLKVASKKISDLETWGEMERKEEPENYEVTKMELQYLYGYADALESILKTIQKGN